MQLQNLNNNSAYENDIQELVARMVVKMGITDLEDVSGKSLLNRYVRLGKIPREIADHYKYYKKDVIDVHSKALAVFLQNPTNKKILDEISTELEEHRFYLEEINGIALLRKHGVSEEIINHYQNYKLGVVDVHSKALSEFFKNSTLPHEVVKEIEQKQRFWQTLQMLQKQNKRLRSPDSTLMESYNAWNIISEYCPEIINFKTRISAQISAFIQLYENHGVDDESRNILAQMHSLVKPIPSLADLSFHKYMSVQVNNVNTSSTIENSTGDNLWRSALNGIEENLQRIPEEMDKVTTIFRNIRETPDNNHQKILLALLAYTIQALQESKRYKYLKISNSVIGFYENYLGASIHVKEKIGKLSLDVQRELVGIPFSEVTELVDRLCLMGEPLQLGFCKMVVAQRSKKLGRLQEKDLHFYPIKWPRYSIILRILSNSSFHNIEPSHRSLVMECLSAVGNARLLNDFFKTQDESFFKDWNGYNTIVNGYSFIQLTTMNLNFSGLLYLLTPGEGESEPKASPNVASPAGIFTYPLLKSCESGFWEGALLLSCVSARGLLSKEGLSAFTYACKSKASKEVILSLIKNKVAFSNANSNSTNGFHWAVYHNDLWLLEVLCRYVASMQTPGNYKDLLTLINTHSSISDAKKLQGNTPLELAFSQKNENAGKLLWQYGARLEEKVGEMLPFPLSARGRWLRNLMESNLSNTAQNNSMDELEDLEHLKNVAVIPDEKAELKFLKWLKYHVLGIKLSVPAIIGIFLCIAATGVGSAYGLMSEAMVSLLVLSEVGVLVLFLVTMGCVYSRLDKKLSKIEIPLKFIQDVDLEANKDNEEFAQSQLNETKEDPIELWTIGRTLRLTKEIGSATENNNNNTIETQTASPQKTLKQRQMEKISFFDSSQTKDGSTPKLTVLDAKEPNQGTTNKNAISYYS